MYAPFLLAYSSDWRMVYVFTMNLMTGIFISFVFLERAFSLADQVPSFGDTAVSDACCTCRIFYDGVAV
jgi:hypothetical protein